VKVPDTWPNRPLSQSVRAGGIEWHVQRGGPNDGGAPTVLLLHGTGAATHSWRDVLPRLAERHDVIAPDLPGHGFTREKPRQGLTLPAIAASLGVLLETLDAAPDLIVGHSAGAAVALRMTLDGTASPRGIVGIAPALLPFPGIAQHLFPTMAKLLFANPFAPHVFAGVARGAGAVERFLARSTGSTIDAAGLAAYAQLFGRADHCAGALGMMADWDLAPLKRDLPKLDLRVLLLAGTRDTAVPVTAVREAAALIPRATVETMPLGHLLHEEHPEDVAARISAFVASELASC